MPSSPFRRDAPKLGRNDPCFCGSGRKFKQCHGRPQYELQNIVATANLEKQIIAEGRRYTEKLKAAELQRQKQQGWGRPIISIEHKGIRFVAVGDRLLHGKWKTFADFLSDYIRLVLDSGWGNAEIAKPLPERHPILQWYDKICHLQKAHAGAPGELFSTPVTGAVSAYHRLAYNLYLIAHNGKDIQTRLIARLKNKDNFQGAYYETQVAAWLIKAGFELEFEDEVDRTTSHCEFTATYKASGEKYSVEAKSREMRAGGSARTPVAKQLRKALVKRANHKRLVFIDLNKALHTIEAADRAIDRADYILKKSEGMEIDGNPAPPAYVCISNMNDQHALDASSLATIIFFTAFKIDDFMGAEFPSVIDAVRARERHWPMFRLFKSMEEHRDTPQTFSGALPSEAFSADPMPRLKVGELYLVPGPDGEVSAELMQAVVMGAKAHAIMRDPKTGKQWIGTFEMTPEELADYAKYPDTYFGIYERKSRRLETVIDLFDFFSEGYKETPKEKLITLVPNHADQAALQCLTQKELVELVAEGYTYGTLAQGFQPKPRSNAIRPRRNTPPASDNHANDLPAHDGDSPAR